MGVRKCNAENVCASNFIYPVVQAASIREHHELASCIVFSLAARCSIESIHAWHSFPNVYIHPSGQPMAGILTGSVSCSAIRQRRGLHRQPSILRNEEHLRRTRQVELHSTSFPGPKQRERARQLHSRKFNTPCQRALPFWFPSSMMPSQIQPVLSYHKNYNP
jgi:hypothetical protein